MSQEKIIHTQHKFSFFGAALFLRPVAPEQREAAKQLSLVQIAKLAREAPHLWEGLLMKRNYRDFAWDHIGGNSEIGEFPMDTMKREVKEEVGWTIKEAMEICRQWKDGVLRGFLYLVVPHETNFMLDTPPVVPCQEVMTVAYYNLLQLRDSEKFKANVRGRTLAFLEGKSDFILR